MTRSSGHKDTFSPISGSGRVSLLPFLFVRILQSTLTENSIITTRSSEHEETFSQILVSWMVLLLPLRQNIYFFLFFFKAPAGASTSKFCRLVGWSVKENIKKCGKCQISQNCQKRKTKKSVKKCQEKGSKNPKNVKNC